MVRSRTRRLGSEKPNSSRSLFPQGVGDVFQEDEAKANVLVFRSVHVPAHLVGDGPKLGSEMEGRTVRGVLDLECLSRAMIGVCAWVAERQACQWEQEAKAVETRGQKSEIRSRDVGSGS